MSDDAQSRYGLTENEAASVQRLLNRAPSPTEAGIFCAMWSEHCSYKSSKDVLSRLPTEGPRVICGPGENAGAVDIGDGQAVVFKIESHNHPSFIEPYEGAATGVGGIMRDVFTMGARPVAMLNALCFGAPDHEKTRHLLSGVVAGIGGYGNCVGIPTLGGCTHFDSGYNGNILVNAMCVGIADTNRIFRSAAPEGGHPVFYIGAGTGRDGVHGATMASASFSAEDEADRPSVQAGDPFAEKRLLESCLELMRTDAVLAIQDMGAAGLTSSAVEMAGKGGVGIMLNLDDLPCREENMSAYEMMLSESQERMLVVLRPEHADAARAIFDKWELSCVQIGETTDTGHLVVHHKGASVADIPIPALMGDAPDSARASTPPKPPSAAGKISAPTDIGAALIQILKSPQCASRRCIWEQYDHTVMADTLIHPGADAALVRVHGTQKALALSVAMTPDYLAADPEMGTRQAVAEVRRNLIAVGAEPLALTNCLNFGNPETPAVMGQFIASVDGLSEAARAFALPVVSGNVSFYNETDGTPIPPTPAIGGVGLMETASRATTLAFKQAGDALILVGETEGHLTQSLYARLCAGVKEGPPPPVDLALEIKIGAFVYNETKTGTLTALHDVARGGLLVALARMALAGGIGAACDMPPFDDLHDCAPHAFFFGEDQARFLLTCKESDADALSSRARRAGLHAARIGRTGGDALTLAPLTLSLAEMREAFETGLAGFMSGGKI